MKILISTSKDAAEYDFATFTGARKLSIPSGAKTLVLTPNTVFGYREGRGAMYVVVQETGLNKEYKVDEADFDKRIAPKADSLTAAKGKKAFAQLPAATAPTPTRAKPEAAPVGSLNTKDLRKEYPSVFKDWKFSNADEAITKHVEYNKTSKFETAFNAAVRKIGWTIDGPAQRTTNTNNGLRHAWSHTEQFKTADGQTVVLQKLSNDRSDNTKYTLRITPTISAAKTPAPVHTRF